MVSFPMSAFLCVAVLCGTALGRSEPVTVPGQTSNSKFCRGSCPLGWVNFSGRCFQYVPIRKDWADAESHCVNLGGNLASVHSEEEHIFLKKLLKANDPTESPFWIGLTDCHKEGRWMWSDGTKVDFAQWNPHEPNDVNGGEDCVHTNWPVPKLFNDIPCTFKYAFICAMRTSP